MKPALQSSAEASGCGPVAVTVDGIQPHDAVEQLQLGAQTGSMPIPTGGEGMWSVETAGTVRDELNASPQRCQNFVWIRQQVTLPLI